MRFQPLVAIVFLAVVVIGCDDGGGPLAPSPVVDEMGPISAYVAVHRGRCPSDGDLPFSVREAGWFWPDTCRNNHGEIIQLSDWCSGTRQVDRGFCALNTPEPPPPPPPPPPPTPGAALTVTGPMESVSDNACVAYAVRGGTAPYHLTSHGGRWMISAPCRGDTPTRHTLPGPGTAIWSATGLDAGDTAQVTVTDADGTTNTFILDVV